MALWGTWLGLASFQPFQDAALSVCLEAAAGCAPLLFPSPTIPILHILCHGHLGLPHGTATVPPVSRACILWPRKVGFCHWHPGGEQTTQSKGQSQWMQEGRPPPLPASCRIALPGCSWPPFPGRGVAGPCHSNPSLQLRTKGPPSHLLPATGDAQNN